jgi:hypothetical protein
MTDCRIEKKKKKGYGVWHQNIGDEIKLIELNKGL